jgi:ATP synthase protein I
MFLNSLPTNFAALEVGQHLYWQIGYTFGFSVFVGAIAGIFYLRLLAKSIGKIGKESNGFSQLQLLVPVCLFLFASKLGSLDIFPAMIGFFIYKPSLIFYFSRS